MWRKKNMISSEKQPREHQLTSLNIDDDSNDAISSSLVSSEICDNSDLKPSLQSNSMSNTNLPLLTTAYLSALTTGATTYAFSFYSSALKRSLHLTQNQLDTLGSATFAAGVFSWIPGMIVDRYGSKLCIVVGGLGNACVLSLYWFIATGRLWQLNSESESGDAEITTRLIFVLSILGVLTFMGCALITGSVFKLIVESCEKGSKGKAVGCAKGYVGVGSGVYVCLFRALFGASSTAEGVAPAKSTLALISILPSSSWWPAKSILNQPVAPTTFTGVTFREAEDNTSPSLEITSTLNFLLMAACFSLLAAVIPGIIFLPKHETLQSKKPRDGTRSVHFRIVYTGLILLGMWVIGTSLLELKEEEEKALTSNSGSNNIPPLIVNKTYHVIESYTDQVDGIFFKEVSYNSYLHDDVLVGTDETSNSERFRNKHDDNNLETQSESHITPLIRNANTSTNSTWKTIRRLTSSATERHWGVAMLLLFLWWGPALSLLCIPPRREICSSYVNLNQRYESDQVDIDEGRCANTGDAEQETFLNNEAPHRKPMSLMKHEDGVASARKECTLAEMLRTKEAWLMAWTFLILVGGGTLMTCNIGQMTEALGFDSDITPASLALFSAAQGASRVVTGSVSESALSWNVPRFCSCFAGMKGVARPAFLVLASLVSAAAHFTLAVASTQKGFAFGVTLAGWAFGMTWPMMVLITGEVFGTTHVGANYMFFDGASSALGTLLLSKFVAQAVYDKHVIKNHDESNAEQNFQCIGQGCFQMSHAIVCFLSLTCIMSSFILLRATKDVYRR